MLDFLEMKRDIIERLAGLIYMKDKLGNLILKLFFFTKIERVDTIFCEYHGSPPYCSVWPPGVQPWGIFLYSLKTSTILATSPNLRQHTCIDCDKFPIYIISYTHVQEGEIWI